MDEFVAEQIRRHSASGPTNGRATNASIAGVAGERTECADEGDEPRTFAEKMRLKRRLAAAKK